MKKSELKNLKGADVQSKLDAARADLVKLTAQLHSSAPPKNPHAARNLRKTIARLLTKKEGKQ